MPRKCHLLWMQCMRILAIDPSLTSLGFAHTSGDTIEVGTLKPKKITGLDRLCYLRDGVTELFNQVEPTLVVYEGYAMGKFVGRMFDRAELGGALKMTAYDRSIPLLLVPPTSLKLFVTGNGASKGKEEVMRVLSKHRGRLFTVDDEADAYGLALMGRAWGSARHRPRDRAHHANRALRGCELVAKK